MTCLTSVGKSADTAGMSACATQPVKLNEVAAQFEALLLAQMLKHMRETGFGGWLGGAEDSAGVTMVEVAEEQLARALASQGGLGLSSLLVNGLSKAPPAVPAQVQV